MRKIDEEAAVLARMLDGVIESAFLINDEKIRAVCMTLINIGELVKLLTEDIKRMNQAIPWRSIAGLRDVTVHSYQTLRMEDIWETVTKDIPQLLTQIGEILDVEKAH